MTQPAPFVDGRQTTDTTSFDVLMEVATEMTTCYPCARFIIAPTMTGYVGWYLPSKGYTN